MNREETVAILKIIKLTYPHGFKDYTKEEGKELIGVWQMMFENDDAEIVTQAVKSAINVSEFVPTVAQIRKQINIITSNNEFDTDEEAWFKIKKALSNSYYNPVEEFQKLDDILKELIGNAAELKKLGQMATATLDTVFKSNFMKSYREKIKSRKEYNNLPQSTKQFIHENQPNNLLEE